MPLQRRCLRPSKCVAVSSLQAAQACRTLTTPVHLAKRHSDDGYSIAVSPVAVDGALSAKCHARTRVRICASRARAGLQHEQLRVSQLQVSHAHVWVVVRADALSMVSSDLGFYASGGS